MIVAERKPIDEIIKMIAKHKSILIVGCETCVAVCFAGGEKEVGVLKSLLKIQAQKDGKDMQIEGLAIKRQCDTEFVDELKSKVEGVDAIISLGCGAGVQFIAERFPEKIVYPGVNTLFIGVTKEQGVWSERCAACGSCILEKTGGVCPIARCSKSLLNGPCGGSVEGKCEIDPDVDCVWQIIFDRLKALDRLDLMEEISPPKDWSTGRDGGPRTVKRDDLREDIDQ